MKTVPHLKQQQIWDSEHQQPHTLVQMDSDKPSGGVVLFLEWIKKNKGYKKNLKGIEMACGKGRNCIWLAKQGIKMVGFDFSKSAIGEASKRAKKAKVQKKVKFMAADAVKRWPFKTEDFDLAIDCFATTDIESINGRKLAADELVRVLKPSSYLLVYTLSTDDEFHKEMIKKSPAKEKNAFINPISGKFEKTFERDEITELYKGLKLVAEDRIKKVERFFGKDYKCKHHWMIFQKR